MNHTPVRDRWEFDRADRLGLASLLVLVTIGGFLAWVVRPIVGWIQGSALSLSVVSKVEVPELSDTSVRNSVGGYDLLVSDPTPGQRLIDLLPGLCFLALIVVACWMVYRVMGDIGRGDPFVPHNVRRLRIAGAALTFGWPVVLFADATVRFALVSQLDLNGFHPGPQVTLTWGPIVVGFVLALLAEAFKSGARLRDDADGLV